MISSSNVEKHNAFQWIQAQMLKNTMFFNDFTWNVKKTICCLMISSSNVEQHIAFRWFQAQMLKNTMNFFDLCSFWGPLALRTCPWPATRVWAGTGADPPPWLMGVSQNNKKTLTMQHTLTLTYTFSIPYIVFFWNRVRSFVGPRCFS